MIRAAFAGLACVLAATGALADEALFQADAAKVKPDLAYLASCADPGGSGQYRVLVFKRGFEHVSSEVYAQWLEWDEDGPRVLETILVKELSSGMWSVGAPTIATQKTCSMNLPASHTYSLEFARFVLQPAGRGKYTIRRIGR